MTKEETTEKKRWEKECRRIVENWRREKEKRREDQDKFKKPRGRGGKDDLDPMDPAAYSDVERYVKNYYLESRM